MEQTDFTEAFFARCTLKNLVLTNSKFVLTEFFQTSLKGIDFSESIIDGISVSDTKKELEGAIVNTLQAAQLAKLLGIVLND